MDGITLILQVIFYASILAVSTLFLYHCKELYYYRNFPGIGHTPLPLVGHSLLALNNLDRQIELIGAINETVRERGREVGLAWLGPKPILLITGPTAAEIILRSSTQIEKAFLYFAIRSWLGDGLLTTTGEKWKSRRRLITPTFHFRLCL